MKKHLLIILALLLCLTSCTADKSNEDTSMQTEPPEVSQVFYDRYNYSSTVISSGDRSIKPIRCFLASGPADGIGAAEILDDPNIDISTFPAITLNGEVSAAIPDGFRINLLFVYDMNLELLDSYGWLKPLSDLPTGEYIIVFREIEHGAIDSGSDYLGIELINEYECIFKLIVPEKQ